VPAEPLAEATVRVRPDTRGFREDLHDQVKDPIEKESDEQGKVFGGRFSEQAKKALGDALKDLPEIKLDADSSTADVKIANVRAELARLSDERIGVTIDDKQFAAEIIKIKAELAAIGAGSESIRIKFDTDAAAKDLERLVPTVAKEAEKAAVVVGNRFGRQIGLSAGQSIGDVFKGGILQPEILVGAAPAIIEAGAAAGGLLLTGIGLAGIGAGIAGQIHDPRVMDAAAQLGADVAAGFKRDTSAFAQPLADVLFQARDEWDQLDAGVHRTFTELAPEVHAFGAGLVGAADKLIPALERGAVAAKPLVDDFSNWLPQGAGEVADLIDTMAENADTLDDGLKLALGTISGIVKALDLATSAGSFLFKAGEWVTGPLDAVIALGNANDKTAEATDHTADSIGAMAAAAAQAVPTLDDLEKQLRQTELTADTLAGQMTDKVVNAFLDSDGATLHLAEAQSRLGDALKENGRQIDTATGKMSLHTAGGQANREAILGVVRANLQFYDTMINAGYSADEAARSYDNNTAALDAQLRKAHLTSGQIDDLIGQYRQVPDKVNTTIAINGLTDAINDLDDLLRQLNGLPARKTVVIDIREDHVAVSRSGPNQARRYGGPLPERRAATGMGIPESDPGTVLAAEPGTRVEWLIPEAGISQARAADLLTSAATPHGLSVGPAGGDRQMLAALGALLATQQQTNALLAGLRLTVGADQLALLVRKGNKSLDWRG
jgi:hypothetical protein